MSEKLPFILTLTTTFPTSAARLFHLWTDAAALLQWSELVGCKIDLRVGGRYQFDFPALAGKEDITVGQYLEVDPPRRVAFTWDGISPFGPTGETLLSVDFGEIGPNCELTLRHEFVHEQSMIECKTGWEYWFNSLTKYLETSAAK